MDRELPSEKQFIIEVRAIDKGVPSLEGKLSFDETSFQILLISIQLIN